MTHEYVIVDKLTGGFQARFYRGGITEHHDCPTLTDAAIWIVAAAKIHTGKDIDPKEIVCFRERIELTPWYPFGLVERDERWEAKQ